eukprot:COSAG02_NODE_415_length_22762_cov_133.681816_25_plen_195_part_00
MQKSYMAQHAATKEVEDGNSSSLPRLCVRVEMAHSHAHGWAPEEISAFADEVLSGQADKQRGPPILTHFSVIGPGSTRHANESYQFRCVVETAGAENALSDVELVYSRALGYWPDRRYNRQPVPKQDWKRLPSNGEAAQKKGEDGDFLHPACQTACTPIGYPTRPALTNSLPLLLLVQEVQSTKSSPLYLWCMV